MITWNWVAVAATLALAAASVVAQPSPTSQPVTRIVLAGDSTVNAGGGWGMGFAERFGPGVEIVNLAQNGRSSKSFRDEGWWTKCLDAKPAILLLQFGHNDQPGKGPERETDPKTTFRENLSRYVAEARAIGAKPVLVTSIERRRFDAAGKIKPSLTEYAEATRAVAKKEGVPLLDMNARSIAVYEQMGEAAWIAISPKDKEGKVDSTHLIAPSSRILGDVVVEELVKQMPELATFVVERKKN